MSRAGRGRLSRSGRINERGTVDRHGANALRPTRRRASPARRRSSRRCRRRLSARYGAGRLLHRKPVLAARGTLEILDGLPAYARHGIFAAPRVFEALARLSNASRQRPAERQARHPRLRGEGSGSRGRGGARRGGRSAGLPVRQSDELSARATATNSSTSSPNSRRGLPAVALGLIRRNGLVGGLKRLKRLAATVGRPFSGFASETFDTLSPFAVGPYAARARLTPVKPAPAGGKDFADDVARPPRRRAARLRAGAAILRRRAGDADRGSDGRLAGGSHAPARRRAPDARGGRARRRRAAVRSLGRARRPPPARRDHARAQGGVFSQPKGARRAVERLGGLVRRRSQRRSPAANRCITGYKYCNSKTPISARDEAAARQFAHANH